MKKCTLFLAALLLIVTANALSDGEKWINKHTESYLGTVCTMRIRTDNETAGRIWQETKAVLEEIQNSVSISVPDSDISRFNALPSGGRCQIATTTAELIHDAQLLYALTGGRFDPSILPLVDLWGFTPRFNTNKYTPAMPYDRVKTNGTIPLPDEAWITALRPLVGMNGIMLITTDDGQHLEKQTPDVVIDGVTYAASMDLGGLAKGYVCDRVLEIMRKYGCTEGYFSCGGSSMVILGNSASEDGCYEMALKKPRDGETADPSFGSLRVSNICISTSNDISQCWIQDDAIYSHIIDPANGWPVNTSPTGTQGGIISVTLLGENAAACDALTTTLMLMGVDGAQQWLAAHREYQAVIVYEAVDGLHVWDCLDPVYGLTITDPAYQR